MKVSNVLIILFTRVFGFSSLSCSLLVRSLFNTFLTIQNHDINNAEFSPANGQLVGIVGDAEATTLDVSSGTMRFLFNMSTAGHHRILGPSTIVPSISFSLLFCLVREYFDSRKE